MANLPENEGWLAGITQLETTDPVLGGPGGKSNEAHAQLASRTRWLRDLFEALAIINATVGGGAGGSGWDQADVPPLSVNNRATSMPFTIPAAPFARRAIVTYAFRVVPVQTTPFWCGHRLWNGTAAIAEEVFDSRPSHGLQSLGYIQRQSVAVDVPAGAPLSLYAQVRGSQDGNALNPVRWHAAFSFHPA